MSIIDDYYVKLIKEVYPDIEPWGLIVFISKQPLILPIPVHQIVILKSGNYKNIIMKVSGLGKNYTPIETNDISIEHIKKKKFHLVCHRINLHDDYTRARYALSNHFTSVDQLIGSINDERNDNCDCS